MGFGQLLQSAAIEPHGRTVIQLAAHFEKLEINGVEDLVECTREADVEVSQLQGGVVQGEFTHTDLGGGVLSTGAFR